MGTYFGGVVVQCNECRVLDSVIEFSRIHIWSTQILRLDPIHATGVPASVSDSRLDIELLCFPCLRTTELDLSEFTRGIDGVVSYLKQVPNL